MLTSPNSFPSGPCCHYIANMTSELQADLEAFPTPPDEGYIHPPNQDFTAAFEMPSSLAGWTTQGIQSFAPPSNALSRYLQQEGPWNSASVGNLQSSPTSAPRGYADPHSVQAFCQMRERAVSAETVSAQDDALLSDSAYFTGPRSDISVEPVGPPAEYMGVESSLMFMKPFSTHTRVNSVPVSMESTASPLHREVTSSPTSRIRSRSDLHACPYPNCGESFKTRSLLK